MEEVADVNNEGPGERGDGDPSGAVSSSGGDLEAAGGALVEDGEEGGVGVFGEAMVLSGSGQAG